MKKLKKIISEILTNITSNILTNITSNILTTLLIVGIPFGISSIFIILKYFGIIIINNLFLIVIIIETSIILLFFIFRIIKRKEKIQIIKSLEYEYMGIIYKIKISNNCLIKNSMIKKCKKHNLELVSLNDNYCSSCKKDLYKIKNKSRMDNDTIFPYIKRDFEDFLKNNKLEENIIKLSYKE